MNNLFLRIVLTSFLILNSGNTFCQKVEQQIDSILMELFHDKKGPGGVALVTVNEKDIYKKAFGKANLELDVDLHTKHIFRIASITKQFTACAILKLAEEGKLSLKDDITKYIKDYPTHGYNITLEHLLTHTSGIKSITRMKEWTLELKKQKFSPLEKINFFKNEAMDFSPGTKFLYNNSGYIILGYIIELVSKKSFEQYLHDNFLKPLGMNSTFYDSNSKIIKNRSNGYQKKDSQYQNANYVDVSNPYSAGALISNLDDLKTWYNALFSYKVISKESLNKAHTSFKLNDGTPTNYGYGWQTSKIQETFSIQHSGGINGFLSHLVYIPKKKILVVVLSNCLCNSPTLASKKIANITLSKN